MHKSTCGNNNLLVWRWDIYNFFEIIYNAKFKLKIVAWIIIRVPGPFELQNMRVFGFVFKIKIEAIE